MLKTGTADGTGPSILTDLITTLPVNQQYTYDFDGVSEVLDHILVCQGIGDVTTTRSCTSTPSTPTRPATTTRRSCDIKP